MAVLLACVSVCAAQSQGGVMISESKIATLEKELVEQKKATSPTRMRRACKSTIRKGVALIEASPTASNRFRVLAIMLQSQKRLLTLENTDRNRDALFDTCSKLSRAPDEYADLRLESDFLLSEKALSLKGAGVKDRTKALAGLIKRYRNTPSEAKSLMIAAMIAPKIDAFDLKKEILNTMSTRFAGDHSVIEWRQKHLGFSRLRVRFTGAYTRADGVALSFPIDRMGHTSLIYFWSKGTPGVEKRLAEVKSLQERFPGQFKVFSFNVDELPDAGEKMLRRMGLDWTAMHLPGGRNNQTYRAYARKDPIVVRVNAHGHAFLLSTLAITLLEDKGQQRGGVRDLSQTLLEQNLDDGRYLAQLQSLLVGDFLVTETDLGKKTNRAAESVPAKTLDAIQACFTIAPMRYRQSPEQALANYTKAEKLCRDAIAKYSKAPDLWIVRNRRIIALLGMWNLGTEPKHLATAAEEARTVLTATLPRGADVVPRFCLAKEAFRRGDVNPESVLSELIEATGGTDAPGSAYAAAAILAMDVNSLELHAKYRQVLLETHAVDPALWPVVTFLRDQNHTFRLFQANYYHPPSKARRNVRAALRSNAAALDAEADTSGPLKAELKTLTGAALSFPQATDGKLTLLMFVEPPADPGADFPTAIGGAVTEDSRGRKKETFGVMQNAFKLAGEHVRKELKVVAVFLSDDAGRVKSLMKKHKWTCQAVLLPGGLKNPLVRRLGILSADRAANIVLLRGDGTIAWKLSGVVHPQVRSEGVGELVHVITYGMKANINSCEVEGSVKALKKGDFEVAVRRFSGPFPQPKKPSPDGWTATRLYGRAVANMGLKKGDAALADIDAAVEAHQWVFNRNMPCSCKITADMRITKATILEQLGKPQEAKASRQRAAAVTITHSARRYWLFHDQIKALSMKEGK